MTMPQNALYHSTNLGNQGQEHFRGNFMKADQPFQGNIHMNSITPNFQNHPPGEIRNSFVRLDQSNKPEVHFGNYARGRPFGWFSSLNIWKVWVQENNWKFSDMNLSFVKNGFNLGHDWILLVFGFGWRCEDWLLAYFVLRGGKTPSLIYLFQIIVYGFQKWFLLWFFCFGELFCCLELFFCTVLLVHLILCWSVT